MGEKPLNFSFPLSPVFRVFIGIIGGTPDKRISEGLFRPLFFLCLVFIGVIGGTPDKRISEALFSRLLLMFTF